MFALLLLWDFTGMEADTIESLRRYIRAESWARYRGRKDLRLKVWFSNEASRQWGAFYLWQSEEAMRNELETMGRVKAMTGVEPEVHTFGVEAVQEGAYSIEELLTVGLAMGKGEQTLSVSSEGLVQRRFERQPRDEQ